MSDTVKIRYWISSDMLGTQTAAIVEVDREDWACMSAESKRRVVSALATEFISTGYEEMED